MQIAGRDLSRTADVFIIAELSGNHGGDIARAKALISAAAAAGADAVKLQTYTADTMTIDGVQDCFRIVGGPWDGRSLYDLYQEASTPWEWHSELFAWARSQGLICFSSPFDARAVAYLETLDAPCYKIASFELVDHPLLQVVAETGKPVIMSTGMATLGEIDRAVGVLRAHGTRELALLHCVSAYPAEARAMHLHNIDALARSFACPAGLSDHSLSSAAAVAALACGAVVIEKHLTLARSDGGPDAGFSLEPAEFADLVQSLRQVEQALRGGVHFGAGRSEAGNRRFRRSIFVVTDMAAGDSFSADNIRVIRPADGLAPEFLPMVLGRRAQRPLERGTALTWDMVDGC